MCLKITKYIKVSHKRESVKPDVEIRDDQRESNLAKTRSDERSLGIPAPDILAAENHYQKSCSKSYIRPKRRTEPSIENSEDAVQNLFDYIFSDFFSNQRVISLDNLTSKFVP